ncbi:MAG: hypothetical protein ACYCX2_10845 [Christensenellales bacterium]
MQDAGGTNPQNNQNVPPQGQYMNYNQQAPTKNNKNLIMGLIIGGAVLVVAAILLIVLLGGGQPQSGIYGKWYEKTGLGGVIEFKSGGSVEMEAMGIKINGTFTFDEKEGTGEITLDFMGQKSTEEFAYEDGALEIGGMEYTREAVKQQNLGDIMSSFSLK